MLVTSIFFFSHNVFIRLFPLVCQKSSSCGKELKKKAFENILGQGIFFFCYNFFFPVKDIITIWIIFDLLSANASNLNRSKILSFGKELKMDVLVECWAT